jgi:hypothetical protein
LDRLGRYGAGVAEVESAGAGGNTKGLICERRGKVTLPLFLCLGYHDFHGKRCGILVENVKMFGI